MQFSNINSTNVKAVYFGKGKDFVNCLYYIEPPDISANLFH